jgi:hypothetical protein
MADIEYSDDEAQVDPEAYKTEELAFGKYKGWTFENMINKPLHRGYLKYLLKWDELKPVTRIHIQQALAAYDKGKKKNAPPPKKKKSSSSEPPKRKKVAEPVE